MVITSCDAAHVYCVAWSESLVMCSWAAISGTVWQLTGSRHLHRQLSTRPLQHCWIAVLLALPRRHVWCFRGRWRLFHGLRRHAGKVSTTFARVQCSGTRCAPAAHRGAQSVPTIAPSHHSSSPHRAIQVAVVGVCSYCGVGMTSPSGARCPAGQVSMSTNASACMMCPAGVSLCATHLPWDTSCMLVACAYANAGVMCLLRLPCLAFLLRLPVPVWLPGGTSALVSNSP